MRFCGIKNVRARASIRVKVMVWCKSRFLVNFSLMIVVHKERFGIG